ncbi:unnamed protein product [Cylicocyclus nassatus]|uniref:Uncharacterized protein n=1 Tax=Cylicocyclus nassatus TaxID=53992 RepID=A0AA36HBF3_CYLNA|nr:unnamed protein product [Cylicocyclus nassatus]
MQSRSLHLALLILAIVVYIVESATIVRRNIAEGFDSEDPPFREVQKRNQFYGLFKKLSYDSMKPNFYLNDGFGQH